MKNIEINISEKYERVSYGGYEPCIEINQDGSAFICCKSVGLIDENEWHGRAVRVNTEGLAPEIVVELYKQHCPITWDGSLEAHEKMQRDLRYFEEQMAIAQSHVDYWNIYDCDRDFLIDDQDIITNWSELTEDNLEKVAESLYKGLLKYEDTYSICLSTERDVECFLRDKFLQ